MSVSAALRSLPLAAVSAKSPSALTDSLRPNLQDSCAGAVAPAVLEEAHQFGLTRNSHMSFAFDDAKVREKYDRTVGKAKLSGVHFSAMLRQPF